MFSSINPSGAVTFPWWSLGVASNGGYSIGLIGDSDTNTSFTIYRGLAYDATLTLNLFQSVQSTIMPGSDFSRLARRPPSPDPKALEVYAMLSASMPDAYQARCNSLALIAPALFAAIKAALPMITKAVPRVGSAVAAAAPVLRAAADLFRGEEREAKAEKVRPSAAAKRRNPVQPVKQRKQKRGRK